MKKILLLLAILAGTAFGQLRYSMGVFYGDIAIATQTSNYVLLGALPAGAMLYGIRIGEAVKSTNTESTNSIQIGIVSKTNYFLGTTQVPMQIVPGLVMPTGVSNAFQVLSSTKATPIYGYLFRSGAQLSGIGTVRVAITYVQK